MIVEMLLREKKAGNYFIILLTKKSVFFLPHLT